MSAATADWVQSRRDVAAHNAKGNPIDSCQQEKSVAHGIAPRRKYAALVHDDVGAEGEGNNDDEAGEESTDALRNHGGTAFFAHASSLNDERDGHRRPSPESTESYEYIPVHGVAAFRRSFTF
jgi:hypothetical protein